LNDPALVEVLPGVPEGLLRLQEAGLRLAMVSNQQGIGLGYCTLQDFIAVNRRLFRELGGHGIRIARVYFCPHSLDEQCCCRKPGPNMITRAMRDFGMPPERTFVIGDSDADIQAGAAAGCRTALTNAGFLEAVESVLR
jgi:D-glycero-D-manno-heptose 1,7-bisphosphate phosphatase